jgi:glycosyltransferase involved in cell wall biosynthesis
VIRFCIIVPVFNHAGTVRGVVESLRELLPTTELCVVDDGSVDGSGDAVAEMPGVTVVRHAKNRGKGAALLTGFRWAAERGYTHAVTVDADGQHCPPDVVRIAEAAAECPDDVIVGWRDMEAAAARGVHVPARSMKGRNAARFWLRVQTGRDIPDTQCGLRAYPLKHVLAVGYWFLRYDFETEVLARMGWGGVQVRSVPVECVYFSGGQRVSHFRPVMDTLRGVRVNVVLVVRRLMPWPMKKLVAREERAYRFGKWWKWATWADAVRAALAAGASNAELATAFAIGVFVGLTPAYFLHTLIAIYLARRLHLNLVAAVIGSQVSIPPLLPVWFGVSKVVGNFVAAPAGKVGSFFVGNALVAVGAAVLGLFAARAVLSVARPHGE